jgi:hypothetical protein
MTFEERYRPNAETRFAHVTQQRQCMTCGACIFEFDGQMQLHHEWHKAQEELRAVVQELNPGAAL